MNTEEKHIAVREPDGKWMKGHSAWPRGRPKGLSISEMLRKRLWEVGKDGKVPAEEIVDKIINRLVKYDDPKLLALILDRVDGKVPRKELDPKQVRESVESILTILVKVCSAEQLQHIQSQFEEENLA